ncbi:MAG: hypothetical protein IT384_03460 [Deltaproteobacteria bacterium]|nr:hypothetical protein [Deltaproteobacteria bacterium]
MSPTSSVAGVLVSLKPEFAAAVAEGRKTVELRRRFPLVDAGVWLVIYVTKPIGAVVGMSPIQEVRRTAVTAIWNDHRENAAISRARFCDYFDDRVRGFAVLLGSYEPVRPIAADRLAVILPGFQPPQSWRYLNANVLAAIRGRAEPGPARLR